MCNMCRNLARGPTLITRRLGSGRAGSECDGQATQRRGARGRGVRRYEYVPATSEHGDTANMEPQPQRRASMVDPGEHGPAR